MNKKISEKKIENGLAKYFISKNFSVKKQVPLIQKRIDIVLKDKNHISAVEVKIYDWKGALRQAFLNKMACDSSYVAIWHEYSHRALNNRQVFEDMGVGLIIINSDYSADILFKPYKETNTINPLAYNYMFQNI